MFRHSVGPGIVVSDFEVVGMFFWSAIHHAMPAACTLHRTLLKEIQGSSTLSSEPQTLLQEKTNKRGVSEITPSFGFGLPEKDEIC